MSRGKTEKRMKTKRFTDEQKILILKELDAGIAVKDLCRKHGVSDATIYNWKRKLGGLEVHDAKRLKALEDENWKLKCLVVEQQLDFIVLKDIVLGKI